MEAKSSLGPGVVSVMTEAQYPLMTKESSSEKKCRILPVDLGSPLTSKLVIYGKGEILRKKGYWRTFIFSVLI